MSLTTFCKKVLENNIRHVGDTQSDGAEDVLFFEPDKQQTRHELNNS